MERTATLKSPVGRLAITANGRGLIGVRFGARRAVQVSRSRDRAAAHLRRAVAELQEYFARRRTTFSLPLDFSRGTVFQKKVWRACARIPFGETRSYAGLAEAVGSPRAARAIGQAMGANPVAIIVPCHRVVRLDGSLGGFGAGLSVKEALLRLEGAF